MKKQLSFSIVILIFTLAISCKKSTDLLPQKPEEQPATKTVSINGKEYPTVTIGDQQWTATNYAGEGGVNLEPQHQKIQYGRYYTQSQAKAIILPEDGACRPPLTLKNYACRKG